MGVTGASRKALIFRTQVGKVKDTIATLTRTAIVTHDGAETILVIDVSIVLVTPPLRHSFAHGGAIMEGKELVSYLMSERVLAIQGTAESVTSVATAPVANVNDPVAGQPVITGTPQEDQTLTADTSGISDADGLGAFSYQWHRDGVAIGGATASTYLLGDADVDSSITVDLQLFAGSADATTGFGRSHLNHPSLR